MSVEETIHFIKTQRFLRGDNAIIKVWLGLGTKIYLLDWVGKQPSVLRSNYTLSYFAVLYS